MSLLSAGDIASMQDTCAEAFDSMAVIQSGTIVSDSGGGGTLAWVPSGTVPCHLSPIVQRGENEGVYAGRISAEADWILTFPADTDLDKDDQILIDGTSYEVSAIRAPRTWELTRRVEAVEVT